MNFTDDGIREIVEAIAFPVDHLLVQPALVAAAKDNQTIVAFIHDLPGFEDEFP